MSFDVGAAVGRLLLDTQGWDSAINQAIEKATGLENITGSLDRVKNAFQPVIAKAMEWVKAFAESDAATARLNAVLAATGGTAGVTAEQINKLATEMQRTTIYEDDAVKNASALLLVYDKVNKNIFPETIKLAADMATIFGGDLSSNAQQLGKALQNPAENLSVLNRTTRAFDEETQKMIKTMVEAGRVTDAQNLILETLEKKVGGAAEAMGKSAAGGIAQMANMIEDLKENLGEVVYTGFKPFIDVIKTVLDSFNSIEAGAGKTVAVFVAIGAALTLAFGPAGVIVTAVVGLINLGKALDDASGPAKVLKEQLETQKKATEALAGVHRKTIDGYMRMGEVQTVANENAKKEIMLQYDTAIAYAKKNAAIDNALGISIALEKEKTMIQAKWDSDSKTYNEREKARIAELNRIRADANVAEQARLDVLFGKYEKNGTIQQKTDKAKWAAIEGNSAAATGAIIEDQQSITDALNAELTKQIQKYIDTYNQISGVVGTIVNAMFAGQQQGFKNETIALDNEYNTKRKYIEANVVDETERTKQIETLEKEKAKKIADIKRRQAESEKAGAIFSAVTSGIQAVMSTFSTFGWPWGLIPAAIMAGITAVNVAQIAAQPIPEFASGGITTGGMAMVGEKGPELVNFGSSARIFSNEQSRGMMGVTVQNTFTGPINSEIDIDLAMRKAGKKLQNATRTI